MQAANTRPWERDYTIRQTLMRALDRHNVEKRTPHTAVNVSGAQCQFLIVQGPGKYDFVRLAKLDGR